MESADYRVPSDERTRNRDNISASHIFTGISAAGNARQHNGNVFNYQTNHYTLRQRRSDETLLESSRGQALLKAAAEGQTRRVEYLIRIGADIDDTDADDMTALHHAALSGFEDTVELLLEKGCDANAHSWTHGTPLCLAAARGREDVVSLLLSVKYKAKIDAPCELLGSALHAACAGGHLGVVRLLAEQGAAVDTLVGFQRERMSSIIRNETPNFAADRRFHYHYSQPLAVAANYDCVEIIDYLTTLGADPNATYKSWRAALRSAGSQIAPRLEAPNSSIGGLTALMMGVRYGNSQAVDLLLRKGADIEARSDGDETAVHHAAKGKRDRCLKQLLDNGAEIDVVNAARLTPLHIAAGKGHNRCVKLLLDRGAQIEPRTHRGFTPLHSAAHRGHDRCVKLLLDRGAHIELQDHKGFTPLHDAANQGHDCCVKLLLQNGAQVDVLEDAGRSPLDLATKKGHKNCVKLLERARSR